MDTLIEIVGKPILSLNGFKFIILSTMSILTISFLLSSFVGYVIEKLEKKINKRNIDVLILFFCAVIIYIIWVVFNYWDNLDRTNKVEYNQIYNKIISHSKIDSLSKMEKEVLNRCLLPHSNYPSLLAIQSCVEDEIEKEKRKEKILKKQQEMNSFKPIQ